ncbi:MAG: AraC family transcriptional regulator [Evtepia sp.]|uniref:AraC family transcriptional regulator n=1 Tax=Evtepia sp. TaxID=2773933 RepID=UPI002A749A83|nr:AraC family transcriptional regulator [Evtepia sp.]MDY3014640.1 AraC family transcriptional regulator [Evtepia sp.]
MLNESLFNQSGLSPRWSSRIAGVRTCRFVLPGPGQASFRQAPVRGKPVRFQVFFCQTGRLSLQPLEGTPYGAEAPGLFLLSGSPAPVSCRWDGELGGILVEIDADAARESLLTVSSALGMALDIGLVKERMAGRNGCVVLHGIPWAQSVFETLRCLPEEEQARYCVFKSVELLYLLCADTPALDGMPSSPDHPVSQRFLDVRAYIQAHLSEKLTIASLCREFSLSPTVLKEGFRRAYGVPVHSFLIQQRLQRARELICTTRMPIQQIAQSVGYEGMSQFNTAFKRQYGIPPGQYRKMSETVTGRPF